MSSFQKRFLEWPLLFFLLWVEQSLEISLTDSLFFGLGHVQLIPVIIVYLSLTRSWGKLAFLTTLFAYIASASTSIEPSLIISTYVWTALIAKVVVTAFALENRNAFTALVGAASLLSKIILWTSMSLLGRKFALGSLLGEAIFTSLISSALAYLIFPVLFMWDQYFEHGIDHSRDLNPTFR